MHDVETIFNLSYVLSASVNFFSNTSDAHETANYDNTPIQYTAIFHGC